MKDGRKAFFTFSKKAYQASPNFFNEIVSTLEEECAYNVDYKWYKERGISSAEKIFQDSLRAMREATIVVAEATSRSTSIGSQISYALTLKKPVIILFNDTLAREDFLFLRGMKSPLLTIINYNNADDLKKVLVATLGEIKDQRLEKFNFIASKSIKEALAKESERRAISTSQLLREIIEEWLRRQQ